MSYVFMHGFPIFDPYYALEQDGAMTQEFEKIQHERTRHALRNDPYWPHVHDQLQRWGDVDTPGMPQVRGDTWAVLHRPPHANQFRLEVMDLKTQDVFVVYEPNCAAVPEAIDWFTLSNDGRYVFYGVSHQGDEWTVLKIFDMQRHAFLSDEIPGTRWTSVAMGEGADAFYYTRYPLRADGTADHYGPKVYRHQLGTPYLEDVVIYEDADLQATFTLSLATTAPWLLIDTHRGWSANELALCDISQPTHPIKTIFASQEAHIDPFWDHNELLGIYQSPNSSSDVVAWRAASNAWETLWSAEPNEAIEQCYPYAGGFLTLRWRCARLVLQWTSAEGEGHDIDLPHQGIGMVMGMAIDTNRQEAWLGWTSFDHPPQLFRMRSPLGPLESWGVDGPWRFEMDVWAEEVEGPDGVFIPIYLAKKRAQSTGPVPTIVGGYGGFNIAYTPVYSPGIALWVESGGLYVVAGLRGGSERGEAWHQAGMRERKQSVFDDMTAVLRYLIQRGYTTASMLGITGRSNGGLLTGALVTQHPELMRSAIIGVPLLDMVRFDQFLVAALWKDEYGDPAVYQQWQWLYRYSPYHHVVPYTKYPAVLLFTSAHDNRVAPLHARKMAARLQDATGSGYPIYLRIEPEAGHGVGKTREQALEEESDIWTFQCRQLGVTPTMGEKERASKA